MEDINRDAAGRGFDLTGIDVRGIEWAEQIPAFLAAVYVIVLRPFLVEQDKP